MWSLLLLGMLGRTYGATPHNRQSVDTRATTQTFLSSIDPNFCTLVWHSTKVIGNTYIMNNGDLQYGFAGDYSTYVSSPSYSTYQLDLSNSWKAESGPNLISNITVNGDYPPRSVCSSTLWTNGTNNIIVFGGERPQESSQDVGLPQFYDFDVSSGKFSNKTITATDNVVLPPRACGTWAQDNKGTGYYLGGFRDFRNDPSLPPPSPYAAYMQPGILAVNLNDATSETLTTNNLTSVAGVGTNTGGSLTYIESIGEKGVLIAFGGISVAATDVFTWWPTVESTYNDMSDIAVFDIDSQTWFHQKAPTAVTNGVDDRVQFCSVSVSAPDNSSHFIYIYGGYNAEFHYQTVHVLSLPLFHWSTISLGTLNISRFEMGCDVVAHNQMLVSGGWMQTINENNIASGETACQKEIFFQVFDLTAHEWTNHYNSSVTSFEINKDLVALVGGTSNGGATAKDPEAGWTDPRLEAIWKKSTRSSSTSGGNSTTSSNTSSKSTSHTGAIAGGVVGGIVGLAIIGGLLWFFLRRKRTHDKSASWSPYSSGTEEVPTLPPPPQQHYDPPTTAMAEMPAPTMAEMPSATHRAEMYAPMKPHINELPVERRHAELP